jgi:hypothetical protein
MKAPEAAAAAFLMAALAVQLGWSARADGLTSDELLYVPSGYLQVARGDYTLNRTHPPLGPSLAGLGLVGAGVRVPARLPGEDDLAYCWRFLHRENAGRALWQRARAPVVVLTLLLAAGLWLWARAAAGVAAGMVALALAAFHPTLLAHGHLATTDLPAAAGMVAASAAYWAWSARPGRLRAALVAAALGLALSVRVTSGLVVPGFVVLEVVALRGGRRQPRDLVELAGLGLLLTPAAVAAAYGFDRHALGSFVEGVRFQLGHNRRGHLTYLLGETSRHGWRHYFLVALLVKSTPGFLLGLALAAWTLLRSGRAPQETSAAGEAGPRGAPVPVRWHWLLPALVTFVALSAGRIQIGERYLLPVHAFAILLVASATPWLLARRAGQVALAAVLAAHMFPALRVAPRGALTYFNALAGGPEGGHRVLLDSNLDWGQDLPRLAAWMRREGVARVALAYDGADDPGRLDITRDDLPGRNHFSQGAWSAAGNDAAEGPALHGTVVVSPSLVWGLVPRHAERYRALRDRAPDARAGVFFVYRLP